MSNGYIGVWAGHMPSGHNVFDRIQKVLCNAIEDLALEGDASWHDHVERADAVRHHRHHEVVPNGVHVTDLAMVRLGLSSELKISISNGLHSIVDSVFFEG